MRKCRTLEITWHESAGRENDGPTKHHNARCENARQICPKKFSNCNRKFNNIKCQCREQFIEMLWWIYALITPTATAKEGMNLPHISQSNVLYAATKWTSTVETDCPYYSQPLDRARLKTRQDSVQELHLSLSFPNVAFSLTTAFVFLQDWLHWLPGLLPILLSISVFIFIFSTF